MPDRQRRKRKDDEIRLAWAGMEARITVPSARPASTPLEVPAVPIAPAVRPVSDLGARVLRLLARSPREALRNAEIAHALTESEGGKLKYLLADLGERGWLAPGPAGYRLAVPGGADPAAYRLALLAWVADACPGLPDDPPPG
jgi:hypothetical protein